MKLKLAWMVLFSDIVGEGETTSPRMASIASRAMNQPYSVTIREIKQMAGALLTQAKNKDKPA
jgi:hypothetical protein